LPRSRRVVTISIATTRTSKKRDMPETITIGAFVFGAVLILVALLGGGFKLFGTEVSGKAGTVQRTVAGSLGALLLIFGLVGPLDFTSHQPGDDRPSRPDSIPAQTTDNAEPSSATREPAVEIAPPSDSEQSGGFSIGKHLAASNYNDTGAALYDRQAYDLAIIAFSKAINVEPNWADWYCNRGMAYRAKTEYDKAISDFNEAIRLNPNFGGAYYNRGIAYREQGNNAQAQADFAKAQKLGATSQ
jgi:Tetratricopeptide repeat